MSRNYRLVKLLYRLAANILSRGEVAEDKGRVEFGWPRRYQLVHDASKTRNVVNMPLPSRFAEQNRLKVASLDGVFRRDVGQSGTAFLPVVFVFHRIVEFLLFFFGEFQTRRNIIWFGVIADADETMLSGRSEAFVYSPAQVGHSDLRDLTAGHGKANHSNDVAFEPVENEADEFGGEMPQGAAECSA